MDATRVRLSKLGLAYRRCGAGRPVVLLHGIPGSAATWEAVARLLQDRFDVVVPDLLGFGGSRRPTGLGSLHAAAQAVAVDALLDELRLPPATVVGHDFGGPVALAVTARRPVAALGLLAANVFPDTPVPFPLSIATWPVLGVAAAHLLFSGPALRAMLRQGVGEPAVRLDPATHVGNAGQRAAIATIFAGSLAHLHELYTPVEGQLRSLDVPVVVGWGDRDPFFPVSQAERTAKAARAGLRLYRGAGHFVPEERPQDVARDIAALAETVAAGPGQPSGRRACGGVRPG